MWRVRIMAGACLDPECRDCAMGHPQIAGTRGVRCCHADSLPYYRTCSSHVLLWFGDAALPRLCPSPRTSNTVANSCNDDAQCEFTDVVQCRPSLPAAASEPSSRSCVSGTARMALPHTSATRKIAHHMLPRSVYPRLDALVQTLPPISSFISAIEPGHDHAMHRHRDAGTLQPAHQLLTPASRCSRLPAHTAARAHNVFSLAARSHLRLHRACTVRKVLRTNYARKRRKYCGT